MRLSKAKIKYLVVGGVGITLSGFVRATADLDLMVSLDKENLKKIITFMRRNQYYPRAPVPATDLLDLKKREFWRKKKNLKAFTIIQNDDPTANIDLLIYNNIKFEDAWNRRQVFTLGNVKIFVASIDDLIKLKMAAVKGRSLDKDKIDLNMLYRMKSEREDG